jgi:SWI/SNF-related matrix-associated actin-dependent regulator 1 of chromatin subfamily A
MRTKDKVEEIKKRIDEEDGFAIAALLEVYSYQTNDEQQAHHTIEQNGRGFNSTDAAILSSIAEQYIKRQSVSERQLAVVKKCLKKYHGQIPSTLSPVNATIGRGKKKDESKLGKMAGIVNGKIKIIFPYDTETVAGVKNRIAGRRFKKEGKKAWWEAPLSVPNTEALIDMGFEIKGKLKRWYDEQTSAPDPVDIDGLYDFQKLGVGFIESRNGRALIADEMGLGKTVQALGYCKTHPEKRTPSEPCLVVCPASVKLNWAKEARKWIPDAEVEVLNGRTPYETEGSILVINYDIMSGWIEKFQRMKIGMVILDECHYIKNVKAKRTKACLTLCEHSDSVVCLSGTPITNRPVEFYTALRAIDKRAFPSFWQYAKRFCGATRGRFGWDFSGATHTDELHSLLTKTLMIRRLKEDVLTDLPAKQRSVVPMELSKQGKATYEKIMCDFEGWLEEQGKTPEEIERTAAAEALTKIEKLKQAAVEAKMKSCIEWIQDEIDAGEKLVVFATHIKTLDELEKKFEGKTVRLDGSTAQNKRQEVVDKFQNDSSIRLFLGNVKAAGVGITLTAASNVVFVELGWTPGEHIQAEDRIHRIGQEADSVMAYYLVADETIEGDIAEMLNEKQKVLDSVLDGKGGEASTVLVDLLGSLIKKEKGST